MLVLATLAVAGILAAPEARFAAAPSDAVALRAQSLARGGLRTLAQPSLAQPVADELAMPIPTPTPEPTAERGRGPEPQLRHEDERWPSREAATPEPTPVPTPQPTPEPTKAPTPRPATARPATPPPAPIPVRVATLAQAEQRTLALMNGSRAQAGLAPYALDAGVSQVARAHSQVESQYGYVYHDGPDGTALSRNRPACGTGWWSENTGKVWNDNVDVLHREFMAEPWAPINHRTNIMDASFARVGIGAVQGRDAMYLTVVFCR